jgi:tRNA pseudouridine55 synthase
VTIHAIPAQASPDGVLVVDKPGGATSHDIVAQARRIFGTREVGHAGTLDPMATGVLLLLFGQATKLSNFLTLNDKRYLATVSFGRATDSFDADGTTTAEVTVFPESLSEPSLAAALAAEKRRVRQVPPAVSAIKVGGKRAHALTRAGAPPQLGDREVRVEELRVLAHEATSLTLELHVSKGYYVRALARDLGASLGLPAHLASLRRLASGQFELAEACAWPASSGRACLIATADAARRTLPVAQLEQSGVRRASLGQTLEIGDFLQRPEISGGATEAWFSGAGELIALGHARAPGEFRVVRGFRRAAE